MESKKQRKADRSTKKYQPAIGSDDFEGVTEAKTIRALDDYKTSRTRDRIAFALLCASLLALAAAALYGILKDDLVTAIAAVWAVVAPFIGGILGYYFRRRESGDG